MMLIITYALLESLAGYVLPTEILRYLREKSNRMQVKCCSVCVSGIGLRGRYRKMTQPGCVH